MDVSQVGARSPWWSASSRPGLTCIVKGPPGQRGTCTGKQGMAGRQGGHCRSLERAENHGHDGGKGLADVSAVPTQAIGTGHP